MAKITSNNTKEINNLTTNVAVILNKVSYIETEVKDIKSKLDKKVDCKEYEEAEKKIESMWDLKNRLLGWIAGISVVGGLAGGGLAFLLKSLSEVMAR
jgi:hypothetical protein